jgi:hypothetical protein
MFWKVIRLLGVAAVAAATVGTAVTDTRADDPPACPTSTDNAYTMTTRALTDAHGTDVELRFSAAPGCAAVDSVQKVQLKTYTEAGKLASVVNRNDNQVKAIDGLAVVSLDRVERERKIEAEVVVHTRTPDRTSVLRGATTSRLRPDLVVKPIATVQTLTNRPVAVQADVAELNGDVGATAKVTLAPVAGPGETKEVAVGPGGHTLVDFTAVAFAAPVPVELTVTVGEAAPGETDATNNTRQVTVDVTGHELPHDEVVLFPSLLGYGAQFNNHLYAPITQPFITSTGYADVEQKVKALEPHLVRIFYNDNWEENYDRTHPEWAENYDSFVRVVELAKEAGATVDISYQNLANISRDDARKRTPDEAMKKFAAVLEDLVKNHGLTNVRWSTIGNEPNAPCARPVAQGGCPDPSQITLEEYEALYRALNRELVDRGLRTQISLMAGGFIESAGVRRQNVWLPWVAQHFGDVVDAYAVHVYWQYNDTGRLEYRLRDTYNLTKLLPADQQKPVFMMEFGIRGRNTCGTKPAFNFLYYGDADCTEIWRTNIAAFQQFWFAIDSAQLGVAGASKWDAYWAVYDRNSVNQQLYWMTGPPSEGYTLTPTYHAMSLLYHVTQPGWRIVQVGPWDDDDWNVPSDEAGNPRWDVVGGNSSSDQPEQELVAYAGPDGQLTVLGIDTKGRSLNDVSADPQSSYSIGGLKPNTNYNLALWNATGDGTDSVAVDPVTTSAAGVARFEVPLQAAFALTTVPVS